MGTFYTTGATKADVVAELKAASFVGGAVVLKSSLRGNELWLLCGIPGRPAENVIQIALLSKSPHGWGYKPMTESMGPYYYKCPIGFLDEAPVRCESWRAKVRAEAALKNSRRALRASS
jgi:hypothetical protein